MVKVLSLLAFCTLPLTMLAIQVVPPPKNLFIAPAGTNDYFLPITGKKNAIHLVHAAGGDWKMFNYSSEWHRFKIGQSDGTITTIEFAIGPKKYINLDGFPGMQDLYLHWVSSRRNLGSSQFRFIRPSQINSLLHKFKIKGSKSVPAGVSDRTGNHPLAVERLKQF
ncbi:hypothetical protein MJO28_001727 [Puccinia striiformis f. sp. tritici]|uniref:Uncharacterized protein n=2 Tax=Puccinia striiformis TaxID=27350 RepID=A0A2S4VI36_9BASI|nr:hypothetical protein MJO28_001727 [Puccinia striiformis f. sp. tritici]POW09030.1 hypothetical protein PSTT_07123 [Puccinia striiformis]